MFRATSGINTHKGMIFTLGLICGAVGWLYHKESQYDSVRIRQVIQTCCAELVNDELINSNKIPATAGERLFRECGITGIRGEAAAGYPTIFNFGLPVYESAIAQGQSEEQAMFKTLLNLMAHNNDSNLVNRGGLEGLKFVQYQAKFFLSVYYLDDECFEQQMRVFDQELIDLNLSPGGSADLLAATWLLAQINLFNR
jgi:triphosphoribosyl-dephospho-CoA synthase